MARTEESTNGVQTCFDERGDHERAGSLGSGTAVTPRKGRTKPTGPSVAVRVVRVVYAGLASLFLACVVAQVFFAGMGAFGADWDWHTTFVHLLEPLSLVMIPVAFLGRLPWSLRLLPLGLMVLVGMQYAFANVAVPAAALHPVNALLIFLISLHITRQAWTVVAGRRKG
jgi:hypothetical protein